MLYNFNSSTAGASIISQPGTPTGVQTNQLWFNTAAKQLFYWNGTHWISQQVFSLTSNTQSLSASTNLYWGPGRLAIPSELGAGSGYEFVMTQQSISAYFAGVGADSTNYWQMETQVVNGSGSVRLLTTVNLTGTFNTWLSFFNSSSSYMAVVNATDNLIRNSLIKAGNPGNLNLSASTFFRIRLL